MTHELYAIGEDDEIFDTFGNIVGANKFTPNPFDGTTFGGVNPVKSGGSPSPGDACDQGGDDACGGLPSNYKWYVLLLSYSVTISNPYMFKFYNTVVLQHQSVSNQWLTWTALMISYAHPIAVPCVHLVRSETL